MTTVAQWIEQTLSLASAPACSVIVYETHQLNLRWALNALTTNGVMMERTATVIVYDADRTASASGSLAHADDLIGLLHEAQRAIAQAPRASDAAPLQAGGVASDFADPAEPVELAAFATLTTDLGQAFADARSHDRVLFGFAELHRQTQWLATSAGTRQRYVQPMGRCEFTAKSLDFVNSAWVGQETRDFTDVDISAHYAELVRRLGWGENRITLEPGQYETILSPGAVVDLLWPMLDMMSQRDAGEGQSVFSGSELGHTRVGEQISSLPITISTDPHAPGIEVAPFACVTTPLPGFASVFDNGIDVGRVDWFTKGKLTQLAAVRSQLPEGTALPYMSDNMIVEGGSTTTIDEMIASTRKGLLVTCLWYIRTVDPRTALLTGLTRDGVYVIEDGVIIGAANNFRWNESPVSLLRRVTEVSAAEHCLCREWNDWFTRSVVPAFRIPDFQMSTVSQAI